MQTSKESSMYSSSTVHRRVKRQYYKLSIDGSGLANERTNLLKSVRTTSAVTENPFTNTSDDSMFSSRLSTTNSDQANETSTAAAITSLAETNDASLKKKVEISVTSLSLSLINLFDRVKGTLCNLIKIECHSSNNRFQKSTSR